jgi:hypothetical protein
MAVFWIEAPCSRPDDGGSKYLWNVGKLLPGYKTQQPRRQPSSYSPPWEPQILLSRIWFSQVIKSVKWWVAAGHPARDRLSLETFRNFPFTTASRTSLGPTYLHFRRWNCRNMMLIAHACLVSMLKLYFFQKFLSNKMFLHSPTHPQVHTVSQPRRPLDIIAVRTSDPNVTAVCSFLQYNHWRPLFLLAITFVPPIRWPPPGSSLVCKSALPSRAGHSLLPSFCIST